MIGFAIIACALCVWLGAASSAKATVTSVSVGNLSLAENTAFNGTLATFTTDDPFDTFSYSIDWGDGTTQTGTPSLTGDAGSVPGDHTYTEDETYTVTVRVTESGASPNTVAASASVTVGEGDASLVAAAPIGLNEGATFSGPVAYVTDSGSPDTASSYTATIDWADGTTTPGTVSGAAGQFTVSGSHTYADELQGAAVKVTVSESGVNGTLGSVQDQLYLNDAETVTVHPLVFAANDGAPFAGSVATFTTSAPASDFLATIDWGDGVTTPGVVSGSGGTLTVSGNHTYNSPPGSYSVRVQLTDDSPGTFIGMSGSMATVGAGKPSAVTLGANGVRIGGATLTGAVTPNGGATTYSFQYGTTSAYGAVTRSASAGKGNTSQGVSASLSGLTPDTTYHYRVVATNAEGTAVGPDQTFTTSALVVSVKARRDGSFLVVVNAPGPGAVRVVVTHGKTGFGRIVVRATRAGRLKVIVRPTRSARNLIGRRHSRITLVMRVTFIPRSGRSSSTILRGLHPARAVYAVMASCNESCSFGRGAVP